MMRAGLRVALAGCGMMLAGATTGPAQDAKQAPSPPFRLEMNVDRLLVPVVVRDRQGHIINDLKQEDFQVFDNNKVRPVSRFTVERRGATVPAQAPPPTAETNQPATLPHRITVFLFDDMHLSVEDLAHARVAGTGVLAGALTGTDMAAVVSVSGAVNTGLTRDREKLQTAVGKLSPHSIFRADTSDCPATCPPKVRCKKPDSGLNTLPR